MYVAVSRIVSAWEDYVFSGTGDYAVVIFRRYKRLASALGNADERGCGACGFATAKAWAYIRSSL